MQDNQEPALDELKILQDRADQLGIKYDARIGVKRLRAKINNALGNDILDTKVETLSPIEQEAKFISDLKKKALAQVRVRVTCMNPNKRDYPGEIIQAGSAKIGHISKYVPFDNAEGWYVPQLLIDVLKESKFTLRSHKMVNGKIVNEHRIVNQYSVEIMEQLSPKEMKALAQRQAMAAGTSTV